MTPHAGLRRAPRLLSILAIAALLAACDSNPPVTLSPSTPTLPPPAASPSPSTAASEAPSPSPTVAPSPTEAPSPSTSPSTSPQAGAWPYRTNREITQTLFPADGRVVVVERDFDTERSAVTVLDALGQPVDGWPWSIDTGNPIAVAALGPDNSLYVAQRGTGTGGADYAWKLHRLSPAAEELPGFPIDLPSVSFCDLVASATGVAYVTCESEDDAGRVTGTAFTAVSPDGSSPFRAPVQIGRSATLAGFGTDDLPILEIAAARRTVIRALEADGTTRWSAPTIVRGHSFVDEQGRIRVTRQDFGPDACGTPLRTTFDMIQADGSHASGWPVVLRGWSSEPAVLADGSMVTATAGGQAYRYTLRGRIANGWPVPVDESFGCFDGGTPAAAAGRVMIVGGTRVTALTPSGALAWSTNPPGTIAIVCPFCTPGSAAPVFPVVARSTYVGTYDAQDRVRVAVLDQYGRVTRRIVVGAAGSELMWLDHSPTGRVWAVTTRQVDETTTSRLSLVGQEAPPTP